MRADNLLSTRTMLFRDTAVVSLAGELDIVGAPLVGSAVARALAARPGRLELDVADLTFCDASGLGAFFQARRAAEAHAVGFGLVGVRPWLRRILTLARATSLLPSPLVVVERRTPAAPRAARLPAAAQPVRFPASGMRQLSKETLP